MGDSREINKILRNVELFSQYYMAGNYDALADAYSRDGKILPPGPDIISGRAAIKQRWILPDGVVILHHKISPTEIRIIDDHAYDIGYYEGKTRRADGSEVSWKGKYLIVWRREGSDWKIYADAWNRVK